MKPDHLAPLLLSLTAAEKKYFVQFSQLRSDDKSYMKLYECVLRDKKYDAARLSKELKKTKANLAHEKEYLTEQVMKALRNFHDKLPEVRINNTITDALLMRNRQLYPMAYQYLKKADKEAAGASLFEVSWKVKAALQQVVPYSLPNTPAEKVMEKSLLKMEEHQRDLATSLRFMQFSAEYQKYTNRIPVATSQEHVKNDTLLLQRPLLHEKFRHPLFRYQQLYFTAAIYLHMRKPSLALTPARKALRIVENNSSFFSSDADLYGNCVQLYMLVLYYAWETKEYLSFLDKLKNRYYHRLQFNSPTLDHRFDAYYYQYTFLYLLSVGYLKNPDMQYIKQVLSNYELQYNQLQGVFDDANWIATQRCVVEIYLHVMHDYNKALDWALHIQNSPRSRTAIQFVSLNKVALVFIHFQLKNFVLLPSLITSAVRYLKKYGPYSPVEQEVFLFINRYQQLQTAKEKKAAFQQLRDRLWHLKDTLPATNSSFNRILYFPWIDHNLSTLNR